MSYKIWITQVSNIQRKWFSSCGNFTKLKRKRALERKRLCSWLGTCFLHRKSLPHSFHSGRVRRPLLACGEGGTHGLISLPPSLCLLPGAKRVLELDQFKGQQGKRHFQDTIGHGSDYSLSEVLWVCANLFSDVQVKMSHKRIMLFTNDDDPHSSDSAKASRARTKAGDLRDTGGHFPYPFISLLL